MATLHMHRTLSSGRRQRGLTLVEFMISVAIGLLLVAAIATLIASQSGNRAEVDRSGRMIENGRYAVRAMSDDLQLAGYWGELNGVPSTPPLAALPDPCSLEVVDGGGAPGELLKGSQLHVQGYDAPAALAVPVCIANQKTGTDILVVRHADPDSSAYETAGAVDTAKLASNVDPFNSTRLFIQTGLNAANTFGYKVDTGANHANLDLKKKNNAKATVRKFLVRIYYVATCSVCTGSGADSIPTLKMKELVHGPAWSDAITIAEGIENMQIDYGVDTNGDGAPEGDNVNGSLLTYTTWPDVMAVKIHLLSRSLEKSPGHVDEKTYKLGTSPDWAPSTDPDAANLQGYKRHVFVQSVRLVNPSARRQP